MKETIITILGIMLTISVCFNVYASMKIDYTIEKGEELLDRVTEDNEDYVLDVLMESDAYINWENNKGE